MSTSTDSPIERDLQGLTPEEYAKVCKLIAREPNDVELGVFGALWSEHCCYKSSKVHLKKLPTEGPHILQGPGENAGVVDLGEGLACVFKIESHNHPSFIEPYQGAATGVGGILRDIFTMGARPIALLDSLSFGSPDHEKTPFLVQGVVSGIAGYGNCMGIPTVGGEVHFAPCYNGNNLVNAMCVGIAPKDRIFLANAQGKGNRVLYLGSKTGRDGIHGATMASEEFGSGNEERRPTVQVGDPFTEKLLLEACLEMMEAKILVGIQDMGAAGLACSTFEMSERGGSGMKIHLDQVPLRAQGMNAWEIFLSESQERMLLVVEPEKVKAVQAIADKWDVDCVDIGEVTDGNQVVAYHHGEKVLDLPVAPLTDSAPLYDRPYLEPKPRIQTVLSKDLSQFSLKEVFFEMISGSNLASREFVYRQYDHTVGADTVLQPGGDAAVMRIKGKKMGLAISCDSNCFYTTADPHLGTMHVVAEAYRNIAVTGAKPVAVTNCLNFGNPEEKEVMGQLQASIRGLGDACNELEVPVTGGNVSLYNQTGKTNIRPTPTIGMIGVIQDVKKAIPATFPENGLEIAVVGAPAGEEFFDSEFACRILDRKDLACPPLDLDLEKKLAAFFQRAAENEWVSSARDCSEGGLLQAVVESSSYQSNALIGAKIFVPENEASIPSFLFNEIAGRVVISFAKSAKKDLTSLADEFGLPLVMIGQTGGETIELKDEFEASLDEIAEARKKFFRELT